MANPFVFLLGCPRSGTTLLRRMVDAHPQIAIVPEIRWLAQQYARRDGITAEGLVTPEFLRSLTSLGRFTPLPIGADEIDTLCASAPLRYADFITLLFDRYGATRDKLIVGHKNADHAVGMDIATLHQVWPDAKFVHLIRDGRDVCLSVLQWRLREKIARMFSTWAESPVSNLALWWEWQVRLGREAGAVLSADSYLEVRYESMVEDPEATSKQLCEFMGVPYGDQMIRFHEDRTSNSANLNPKKAWLPPTPGLRNWRKQMPEEDVARFEAVAGGLLEELGYRRLCGVGNEDRFQEANRLRHAFQLQPLPRTWIGSNQLLMPHD